MNPPQTDLCWQSNVSALQYAIYVGHNLGKPEYILNRIKKKNIKTSDIESAV